jgi:hypothetical protein
MSGKHISAAESREAQNQLRQSEEDLFNSLLNADRANEENVPS